MYDYIYVAAVVIALVVIATQVYAGFRAAPWAPTRAKDSDRFLKLADIKQGQKFYDLGCGDGRMLKAAAEAGAIAEGFEISFFPYIMAKIRLFGVKNANVRYRDFWNIDLSDGDIVYFFLLPKIYPKIQKKLQNELRKGGKVITYVWPFDAWKAKKIDSTPGVAKMHLYVI